MNRQHNIIFLFCLLILTGCVDRKTADERLSRGCAAAAELFLDEGYAIKNIKKKTYKNSEKLGKGYRNVTLFAVESDGWVEIDKEYHCTFAEEFGVGNSSHRASIYQVNVNNQIYGKEGDKILGDMAGHLKLFETVERAMGQ